MQGDIVDIQLLVQAAKKAGKEILKYYRKIDNKDVEVKCDKSPVTAADYAADRMIDKSLQEAYPNIPRLSEESDADIFKQRLQWSTYFLIDPLDGTKEFIRGSEEFTVNIALIDKNESVMGVIYQPVTDTLYYGDLRESYKEFKGEKVRLPCEAYILGKVRVVSSKSHKNQETENYISNLRTKFEVEALCFGSSLKICKVAEGVADINPRLGGTSEWDIAAGHAILRGARGDIVLLGGKKRVRYNKEDLINPFYEAKRAELL